jgi:exopolyphosphatase/guanosine-5'-triphosphate,3'-diphosphate pyrophosphatase
MDGRELVPIEKERVRLSLGAEIERSGVVSDVSIAAAAKAVGKLCSVARRGGAETLDVFLTAPGRQSGNADELLDAIVRAAKHSVRILSTEEEGRLAYAGAVATADVALPRQIAVCDVGGASTEIAVGDPGSDPRWIESIDLGSVRLTERVQGSDAARAEASRAFAAVSPPSVQAALAVGGSARAARRLVGPWLGEAELAEALRIVASKPEQTISRRYGVHRTRAKILPAGLVLLSEVQQRLGVPLHVCDGGIREGAVLATVAQLAA